jgi:hypothetical protein
MYYRVFHVIKYKEEGAVVGLLAVTGVVPSTARSAVLKHAKARFWDLQ